MAFKVFLSYRRKDSPYASGRLRDRLTMVFGEENVFLDVDSIPTGRDFREVIRTAIQAADAVVVMIGPGFDVARLSDQGDYVRMELLEAFRQKKVIVPVLIDTTLMPPATALPSPLRRLAYINASPIRQDPDFHRDAERLIATLRRTTDAGGPGSSPAPPGPGPSRIEPGPESQGAKVRDEVTAHAPQPTGSKKNGGLDVTNPVTAVTWGPFIQASYDQFVSDPGQVNPVTIMNMPAGYTLVRTIQMSDFATSRVFYGFVAVGGDPKTAVVALRGTDTTIEWWDDFHWDLVPFTQVPGGGKVAQGLCGIYNTFGTMTPGQQDSTPAPTTFAADIARAVSEGFAGNLDPALPMVVTGHSLGGALATLLVADLTANTPLKPLAWTFASPRVGDATFAARYSGLSTVSWRIYNQPDIVPNFPADASDNYQPVATGYAINSRGHARPSLGCAHALNTYLHMLSPATVPLNPSCS